MKTLIFILFPVLLSAQTTEWEKGMATRQRTFNKYEPSHEVARAMLPGLLGFVGGAMNTDHARGRIVQQTIFFGAVISIGSWGKRPAKFRMLDGLCFVTGCALGAAVKQAEK